MSKPTGQRWWLRRNDKHALAQLVEWVQLEWVKGNSPTMQMLQADRTTDQNAMFYGLYRDIANAMADKSIIDVKRECKLRYGVAIRKGADPEWAAFYNSAIKPMPYEQKLILMDEYPVTRAFTKAQASEYITTIINEYTNMGFPLADPRMAE